MTNNTVEPTSDNAGRLAPSDLGAALEPLRYHRLGRLTPAWWTPLLTVAVAVGLYLAGVIALMITTVVAGLVWPNVGVRLDTLGQAPDMNDPVLLAVMLGMLALLVPATRLAVRITGRPGTLDSVTGRFRWRLLVEMLPPALVAVALGIGLMLLDEPVDPATLRVSWPLVALALLLVPLQAAGEEYLFRGLIQQVVGAWLRAPLWGVLVSVPLFVAGHGYNAPGLVSVAVFALAATWVTWRTGGLEAAIALHAVNNMTGFLLGAVGLADMNATEATWTGGVLSALIPLAFAGLVAVWWRLRGHLITTSSPALPSSR